MNNRPESNPVIFDRTIHHDMPHGEEILADMLLRMYAEPVFPGISQSKRIYVNAGEKSYRGSDGETQLKLGILALGVCGSIFDEHPLPGEENPGTSCVWLVYNYLREEGLIPDEEALAWIQIVERADLNDRSGESSLMDIFQVVQLIYKLGDPENRNEEARIYAELVFGLQFKSNLEVFTNAAAEYSQGDVRPCDLACGYTVDVAVVNSDHPEILRYATTSHAGRPAILVQRRSSGNVGVYLIGNNKHRLKLNRVAKAFREKEAELRGQPITDDESLLEGDAQVEGAECWYYQSGAERLMNGSLRSEAEPTKLTVPMIVGMIKAHTRRLTKNEFEASQPRRSHQGQNGQMTARR